MISHKLPMVKVGCCGFPGGKKEYFRQFRLVEVQQTFYKMPKLETAERWRREAPAGFEFTLKAWQLITHLPVSPTYRKAGISIKPGAEKNYGFFQPSDEISKAWEETRKCARALEAKIILFQCPPSFTETSDNIANMRRFFSSIKHSGHILVWEPRGQWAEPTIKALCSELDLVHCVDPMRMEPLSGELYYVRLHGGPGYRHKYTKEELKRLKGELVDKETYVLFNNLNMYNDALAFDRLIKGRERES